MRVTLIAVMPPTETLALALRGATVDRAVLQRQYGPQFAIVRKMLGDLPNVFEYAAIWPAGLRAYHLLVPNFLNLPFLLFGWGPPKATVGLAMYAASNAAGCRYCTAHSCTFALRRGANEESVALVANRRSTQGAYSGADLSALDVAEGLGRVPSSITQAERDALRQAYSNANVEWMVLAIAKMGFLNKFNDALGIPLEASMLATAEEVIGPAGWTPGIHLPATGAKGPAPRPRAETMADLLGLLPLLPSVIYRDKRWTSGMPSRWPAVGTHLSKRSGHDFPLLANLTHGRAVRALATVLRDHTDAGQSRLGICHRGGKRGACPLGAHLGGSRRRDHRTAGRRA